MTVKVKDHPLKQQAPSDKIFEMACDLLEEEMARGINNPEKAQGIR